MLHEKRVLVIGFGGIVKKLIPLLKAFEVDTFLSVFETATRF